MRKFWLASFVATGLAISAFAHAAVASETSNAAEARHIQERQAVMLDAHLAGMKAGLKLTDEQAQNWPAFETAIRDAAKARVARWNSARDRMAGAERPSTIERMSLMADHLDTSAAELRKVVDASKPLYASLTDTQKRDFGPLMRQFKPRRQR